VIVVEIKTGRAWPEHQAQLAVYVEAARALFPGSEVEGRLIYDD
jgi:RecB family endonuclease NucS